MVQFTPAFAVSFDTVAAMFTAAPVDIMAGGASPVVNTTEIAAEGVTVIDALTDTIEDAADVATIVTVRFAASPVGAVYVDGEPLSVCSGAMAPQFDEPEQVTLQTTPAPVASFVTCATTASLPPAPKRWQGCHGGRRRLASSPDVTVVGK